MESNTTVLTFNINVNIRMFLSMSRNHVKCNDFSYQYTTDLKFSSDLPNKEEDEIVGISNSNLSSLQADVGMIKLTVHGFPDFPSEIQHSITVLIKPVSLAKTFLITVLKS
jgi:hypothetical protein